MTGSPIKYTHQVKPAKFGYFYFRLFKAVYLGRFPAIPSPNPAKQNIDQSGKYKQI